MTCNQFNFKYLNRDCTKFLKASNNNKANYPSHKWRTTGWCRRHYLEKCNSKYWCMTSWSHFQKWWRSSRARQTAFPTSACTVRGTLSGCGAMSDPWCTAWHPTKKVSAVSIVTYGHGRALTHPSQYGPTVGRRFAWWFHGCGYASALAKLYSIFCGPNDVKPVVKSRLSGFRIAHELLS